MAEENEVLYLHCDECALLGQKDSLRVLVVNGDRIFIGCENHDELKRVFTCSIPEEERPKFECRGCELGLHDDH